MRFIIALIALALLTFLTLALAFAEGDDCQGPSGGVVPVAGNDVTKILSVEAE